MAFKWGALCFECEQRAKAEAQAKTVNVKGGGK